MRAVIIVLVIVLILAAVGWLQFSSPNGDPTLRVDTDKVKQDTTGIVEQSKQAIDRTAEAVDASIDREPDLPAE